nr:hypothetical protein B296_00022521 [Ipomoea trifida]
MSERRDDVDGEANKEGTNGRVDWAEEGEDDGQEPYRYDHGQPSQGPHANASRVVHPYHLLPHEWKWVRYLVDEHEDDGGVSPGGFGEEGEGVGVVEKLVAERPVHGGCRRKAEPSIPSRATMPEKALHTEQGLFFIIFVLNFIFAAAAFMFQDNSFLCLLLGQHCCVSILSQKKKPLCYITDTK